MFCFFGPEACGILAPQPGIESAPPALECEVLTTGPPGKSLNSNIFKKYNAYPSPLTFHFGTHHCIRWFLNTTPQLK